MKDKLLAQDPHYLHDDDPDFGKLIRRDLLVIFGLNFVLAIIGIIVLLYSIKYGW